MDSANGLAAHPPVPLEGVGITAGYGEMAVIRDVDLAVRAGEISVLVGPNGAGKSTTLQVLAGAIPVTQGSVCWYGVPTNAPIDQRCRNGLGYVTEEKSVIMSLTARENIKIGSVELDDVLELFPELRPLLDRPAGLLSGGEQQMLTLGRALARRPSVLLIDELSLGLAPLIVKRLLDALRQAAEEQGVGVLLVEQHIRLGLSIADHVNVMQRGRIVLSGPVDEVQEQILAVEDAYLGAASA